MLLYSKAHSESQSSQFNYDFPVRDFRRDASDGLPAMKLTSMGRRLRDGAGGENFLDLKRGGIISADQLAGVAERTPGDFANPMFNIQPANRPPLAGEVKAPAP